MKVPSTWQIGAAMGVTERASRARVRDIGTAEVSVLFRVTMYFLPNRCGLRSTTAGTTASGFWMALTATTLLTRRSTLRCPRPCPSARLCERLCLHGQATAASARPPPLARRRNPRNHSSSNRSLREPWRRLPAAATLGRRGSRRQACRALAVGHRVDQQQGLRRRRAQTLMPGQEVKEMEMGLS